MEKDLLSTIEAIKEYDECQKALSSLSWGSIEIRERDGRRYIYIHRREGGILRSLYVGEYSEELLLSLRKDNEEARQIKSKLRKIDKKLKEAHISPRVSDKVKDNVDMAKRNLVDTIYKQALLEGVAVTFLDTETIIEGGKVNGISSSDIQKVNNLKHAWEFVLDEGTLLSPSGYDLLCYINKLVDDHFHYGSGELRRVPVSIGGSKWKPPLPIESLIKEDLAEILAIEDIPTRAMKSLLYVCKGQPFIDGNKRTATIFANHILISNGAGLLVVPDDKIKEYRDLLIHYYEGDDDGDILAFLNEYCLTRI